MKQADKIAQSLLSEPCENPQEQAQACCVLIHLAGITHDSVFLVELLSRITELHDSAEGHSGFNRQFATAISFYPHF